MSTRMRRRSSAAGPTNFMIVCPEISGMLLKRGFRWMKLWKERWVNLVGRQLMYLEQEPEQGVDPEQEAIGIVYLSELTELEEEDIEGHPFGFTVTPAPDSLPWHLRASSMAEKSSWIEALRSILAILRWLSNFEKGKLLGVGGTGVVRQYRDKRTKERLAVKEVEIKNKKHLKHALREVEVLQNVTEQINHPNLINIRKVVLEGRKLSIMFQLCTGGEVYERVVKRGKYSERDASRIMFQIISGLQALHENGILHLDIKPENILFENESDDSHIIITDFGLSRYLRKNSTDGGPTERTLRTLVSKPSIVVKDVPSEEKQRDEQLFQAGIIQKERLFGTVGYMSPEIVVSRSYTPAADIWAAGVVLYILLVGYPPFNSHSERVILEKSARGEYDMREEDWGTISDEAKDLVRRMLVVDPEERISTSEVLEHPWIANASTVSDAPLSATTERMIQYNTERQSTKMQTTMSKLQTQLRKLSGFNGIQPLMEDSQAAAFLNSDMQERMSEFMHEMSGGTGKMNLNQFTRWLGSIGLSPIFPIPLAFRFFDRDADGFVSLEDMIDTHTLIITKSEPFLRAIFRIYSECKWYPGAVINRTARAMLKLATSIENAFGGSPSGKSTNTTTTTGFSSPSRKGQQYSSNPSSPMYVQPVTPSSNPFPEEDASLIAGVEPFMEDDGRLSSPSQQSTTSSFSNPPSDTSPSSVATLSSPHPNQRPSSLPSLIEPPKFITAENVAAAFKLCGYDPKVARELFETVYDAIESERRSQQNAHGQGRRRSYEDVNALIGRLGGLEKLTEVAEEDYYRRQDSTNSNTSTGSGTSVGSRKATNSSVGSEDHEYEGRNEEGRRREEEDEEEVFDIRTMSMEVSTPAPTLFTPDGKPIKFAKCKQCGEDVERSVEAIEAHMESCEGGLEDIQEENEEEVEAEQQEGQEDTEQKESQKEKEEKVRHMDFEMFVQAVEIAPVLVNIFSRKPREAISRTLGIQGSFDEKNDQEEKEG